MIIPYYVKTNPAFVALARRTVAPSHEFSLTSANFAADQTAP